MCVFGRGIVEIFGGYDQYGKEDAVASGRYSCA